jgi:hypothetical protein
MLTELSPKQQVTVHLLRHWSLLRSRGQGAPSITTRSAEIRSQREGIRSVACDNRSTILFGVRNGSSVTFKESKKNQRTSILGKPTLEGPFEECWNERCSLLAEWWSCQLVIPSKLVVVLLEAKIDRKVCEETRSCVVQGWLKEPCSLALQGVRMVWLVIYLETAAI